MNTEVLTPSVKKKSNSNRKPIRLMSSDLAEKIAAGEVVERPASIVKELVENSIDAQANSITVELFDGGRKKLTVLDNGIGILESEAELALQRHATSKIQSLEDLWKIETLGFRGEALPSIATVSRFTLETKTSDETGMQLYLEGGKIVRKELLPQVHVLKKLVQSHGTQMTVEDLFYNVPARLRFLKSKASEVALIRDLMDRLALTHPEIQFTLLSEGRRILDYKATSQFEERVAQVFDTTPQSIETLNSIYDGFEMTGWLDRNSRTPNSKSIFLSVNDRMVRDKLLQQAVLVGLRPRLMEGEYPKIFVSVKLPFEDVDVNVHPNKQEVRFRSSKDVFQIIHGALDQFAKKVTKPFYELNSSASFSENFSGEERNSTLQTPSVEQNISLIDSGVVFKKKSFYTPTEEKTVHSFASHTKNLTSSIDVKVPVDLQESSFSNLDYIGQFKNTYLLFQDINGLIVIDQHAAHERIHYERLKKEFQENGLKAQPLLISITVKVRPEQIAVALENESVFEKLGIEFESFGNDCIILRAIPEVLKDKQAADLFKALLEHLSSNEEALDLKDPTRLSPKIERLIATAACHASVRAGQTLSREEAISLSKTMEITDSALNCPHGRPASIRLSVSQLENFFKRT